MSPMSEITYWTEGGTGTEVCHYADALAAVAAAEQRGIIKGQLSSLTVEAQREIRAEALKAARDAVENAYPCRCLQPQPVGGHWGYCPRMEVVPALTAIDGVTP